jgi:hypothetical protein
MVTTVLSSCYGELVRKIPVDNSHKRRASTNPLRHVPAEAVEEVFQKENSNFGANVS